MEFVNHRMKVLRFVNSSYCSLALISSICLVLVSSSRLKSLPSLVSVLESVVDSVELTQLRHEAEWHDNPLGLSSTI
jgi:hypothetical protein